MESKLRTETRGVDILVKRRIPGKTDLISILPFSFSISHKQLIGSWSVYRQKLFIMTTTIVRYSALNPWQRDLRPLVTPSEFSGLKIRVGKVLVPTNPVQNKGQRKGDRWTAGRVSAVVWRVPYYTGSVVGRVYGFCGGNKGSKGGRRDRKEIGERCIVDLTSKV